MRALSIQTIKKKIKKLSHFQQAHFLILQSKKWDKISTDRHSKSKEQLKAKKIENWISGQLDRIGYRLTSEEKEKLENIS